MEPKSPLRLVRRARQTGSQPKAHKAEFEMEAKLGPGLPGWRIRLMSGTTDQFEGGCLCGAIRFTATGRAQRSLLVPLPKLPQA